MSNYNSYSDDYNDGNDNKVPKLGVKRRSLGEECGAE